jgi:hypothetical protein|nr:MAG TPA: hypothetical protein [Caudoviricetes sp.]
MAKENNTNAYLDLLEQYNIYLEGEKMNGNSAVYADQMFQVLVPIFGNTKEKLESNQLDIGFIFYSKSTDEYYANLLQKAFIRPSCITEDDEYTFDRAVSSYLYLILIKQNTDLTVNDLIKLLRTVLVVDIEDKNIEELTSWYLNSLSGVISYIQDNIKKRSEDTNPAYPIEVHYEPDLERIGVTFVYKQQ